MRPLRARDSAFSPSHGRPKLALRACRWRRYDISNCRVENCRFLGGICASCSSARGLNLFFILKATPMDPSITTHAFPGARATLLILAFGPRLCGGFLPRAFIHCFFFCVVFGCFPTRRTINSFISIISFAPRRCR